MIKIPALLKAVLTNRPIWNVISSVIVCLFLVLGLYSSWNYTTIHNKKYKKLLVPQKIKVGFLKTKTVLVEVNCDSLQRTFR